MSGSSPPPALLTPLLHGVWFLLPHVAWESPDAARDFRADVKSLVGDQGVTDGMLDAWADKHPAGPRGKAKKPAAKPKPAKRPARSEEEEE